MGETATFITKSSRQTEQLGEALGRYLQPGEAVLLSGTLGAGKTVFAKGVARGVGVTDEVTSPTFTLVAEYLGRYPFVHIDLYRLYGNDGMAVSDKLSVAVLDSIGFDSYMDDASILLIEWPQGVADFFDEAIRVHIGIPTHVSQDERLIFARAIGVRSKVRLDEWVTQWQF